MTDGIQPEVGELIWCRNGVRLYEARVLAICFPKYQFAMEYNKVVVKPTSGWRRNPRMVDIGDCARVGQVEATILKGKP